MRVIETEIELLGRTVKMKYEVCDDKTIERIWLFYDTFNEDPFKPAKWLDTDELRGFFIDAAYADLDNQSEGY